ncbi:hypothetical protein MAJHIDBO_00801 [Propionibacterium freudenreichii subsp. shermanii]|nr:hypothetical protein MAJHIDBO_00801 [Propionibacterium freudenreichii subsp. shermanii]SPS08605.1 hypothetical protein MAJHIDBO_00801 [Propionibacterium freudenreichii subsp. shermanii]
MSVEFSVKPLRRPATSAHALKVDAAGRAVVAQLICDFRKSGPPYRAYTSPVPTPIEATAACRVLASWLVLALRIAVDTLSVAVFTAASCIFWSKVVVMVRPPPSICSSLKPALRSSCSAIVSRKPLVPP